MPVSHEVNRRDFVKLVTAALGTVMGTVIAVPAIAYIVTPAVKKQESDAWVPLGPLENFPPGVPTLANFTRTKVNGWEKTTNTHGVYVTRLEGDQVTTFSSTCTHLSCRVKWVDTDQLYECPCHDAAFDINGAVIAGPPPRPLDAYENKVEEGILYVHYLEG